MAVYQIFVFLSEFCGLGIVMRINGYRHSDIPIFRWNQSAVFLRENVWIAFAVPLLWFALALWAENSPRSNISQKTMLFLGGAVTILLSVFYVDGILHPVHLKIVMFME